MDNDINLNSFWLRIDQLIQAQNKTLKDVCDYANINYKSVLTKRVNKANTPKANEVLKFSQALKTDCEYLLTGKHANGLTDKQVAVLQKLEGFTDEQMQQLIAIIDTFNITG